MRNRIWSGTFAAIVGIATVSLFAQTTPPQTPTAATPSSANKITVTGCLQADPSSSASTTTGTTAGTAGTAGAAGTTAGTAGTTGTTGTAGAAGAAATTADAATADAATANMKFILVDAVQSSPDAATTTAETGTTAGATGATAGTGQTYRLIANPTALSPHVGKKVELTGTLDQSDSSSRSSTATSSDPSAATSAANAPTLKVEAGKVLTAPCSQ